MPGGAAPALAGPEERAQLAAGLEPVVVALQAALAPGGAPAGGQPCGGGWLLKLEAAIGRSLSQPAGQGDDSPLLPTINGWLLQYPVVYVVTPANADTATASLCSTSLALFKVILPCSAVTWNASRGGLDGAEPDVLYSYSAPAALAEAAAACSPLGTLRRQLAAWKERGCSSVWGEASISVSLRAAGPVAL